MDQNLKSYLQNHKIDHAIHNHPAVFTVEESKKIDAEIPGVLHTKNLLLKDAKNNFYLVCMYAHQRLNLKLLKEKSNANKKLTFASPAELKAHLNISPGSVSIFNMIYAKNVQLIIDKKVWSADRTGFHPNINTATLELAHKDLEKFCDSIHSKKQIIDLENE